MVAVLKTDGGGKNNERVVSSAALFVYEDSEDLDLHSDSNLVGTISVAFKGTTNDAEMRGFIVGLSLLDVYGSSTIKTVYLFSDSQLCVNLITGLWRCHAENLKPLLKKVKGMLKHFDENREIFVQWISRDLNEVADHVGRI